MSFLINDAWATAGAAAPEGGNIFMTNLVMIVLLVAMFYFLLIRPQQKRFKEHKNMLSELKKGDKVLTVGGLVAKIDKITEGEDDIVLDVGHGTKMNASRSAIQNKIES